MAFQPAPRQWLLIGVVCGLVFSVVVRSATFLVLGSLRLMAIVGGVLFLWVVLRGPRDGAR